MSIDYIKQDKIAIFTLNRPEALNAIDPETAADLSRVFIDFKNDDRLMVGIITGAGTKAFSIGADVQALLPKIRESRGERRK